ncbi:MAG: DUF4920 domain-containing protein [Acidobacteria bacterium]|nr:DUF4920 domain-containing protein [Acidobacteriota bacterium]
MKIFITALLLCALPCLAAEKKLGKPLALRSQTPIADIVKSPDQYVDKTVQVKGRITEVCEKAGCWTNLVDADNKMIKVKVNDGEIVFPKEAVGKTAIAEGTFKKFALTKEQAIDRAKHEAEEQGRKFDPATIKSGTTIYQIAGTGAVVLE